MDRPLLSVIIANYNYGRYLGEAITSVISQNVGNQVELIVCDGGSSDNSIDVIKKFETHISWWVSEKDKGQSDAFNKGFAHSKGLFLTWLNADDILLPGVIQTFSKAVQRHPECEWYTGNFLQFRQDTKEIILAPWGPHVMPAFLQTFNSPLVVFGPTTFWSRKAYDKVGPIDVDLHYSMDTDYWLRMKKAGYRQRRLNCCCWAFRMHDVSKTAQYEGREIDKAIMTKWYDELQIVNNRNGYKCSQVRRLLSLVLRVLDFSAVVAMWRRVFVVGRTLTY